MSAPYRSYVITGTALVQVRGATGALEQQRIQFNSGIIRAGAKLREMVEQLLDELLKQTGGVSAKLNRRNSFIEVRHLWVQEREIRKIFAIHLLMPATQKSFDLFDYEFLGEPHVIYR